LNVGLTISIPNEEFDNRYISRDLHFYFHYFFMRKFWFVYLAKAVVLFPGGFGTLDEMFEIFMLIGLTPKTTTGSIGQEGCSPVLVPLVAFPCDDLPFSGSLPEFQQLFPDELACAAYLEAIRLAPRRHWRYAGPSSTRSSTGSGSEIAGRLC
jgi:Possible lysine decarboxylase